MCTCKYKSLPLEGVRPVQTASFEESLQVALTVLETVPINPRSSKFHRMDM